MLTEALLPLPLWFLGGCSSSRIQILFLGNPCRSNVGEVPNCMEFYSYQKLAQGKSQLATLNQSAYTKNCYITGKFKITAESCNRVPVGSTFEFYHAQHMAVWNWPRVKNNRRDSAKTIGANRGPHAHYYLSYQSRWEKAMSTGNQGWQFWDIRTLI
jgi:hypothetical protein